MADDKVKWFRGNFIYIARLNQFANKPSRWRTVGGPEGERGDENVTNHLRLLYMYGACMPSIYLSGGCPGKGCPKAGSPIA